MVKRRLLLVSLSGVIAVLGLLAGSTATVIGAMISVPLMGPIRSRDALMWEP